VTEADEKTPVELAVEHALELFVYAPVGLLFEGASLLPHLIEKGRGHVSMARMVGRFAVRHRRTEATKKVSKLQDQAAGMLGFLGDSVTAAPAPSTGRRGPSTARSAPPRGDRTKEGRGGAKEAPVGPRVDRLAIPDYDSLSASQVVNRLAGLSPAELRSVRRYEEVNRGRKTILSKAAQLQGS